jgi:hypothetical protein
MSASLGSDGLALSDPDTLRRLVRVERLTDATTPYPYRDPDDGWYADEARRGTTLHWTLPMDAVILALDRFARPLHPGSPKFAAAAAWSGPVLAVLGVLVYYALAARWMSAPQAYLAALLGSLAHSSILGTAFGNGDHAALQGVCATAALLGLLAITAGRAERSMAILTGAALGLGLWVTSETMVAFYAMALGALLSVCAGPLEERRRLAWRHVEWAIAALLVAAAGDRVEHPGAGWTFEWDQVSGFQLYQLGVFSVFALLVSWLLARSPARPPLSVVAIAAAAAIGTGLLPFALSGASRVALSAELGKAHAANLWAQSQVSEYRALFSTEGFFVPNLAWERFTWPLFALPVFLLGVWRDARPVALRLAIASTVSVLFAFTCYEMKLGHLFMVVFPVAVVVGGGWLATQAVRRSVLPQRYAHALGSVAAVFFFLLADHPVTMTPVATALARGGPFAAVSRPADLTQIDELMDELRTLVPREGSQRSILADWTLGAYILYHTDHPVVASGYHRNLAGIRDAYRVFVARIPEDVDTLSAILRERGVGWIVTKNDTRAYAAGTRSFPDLGEFARYQSISYLEHGDYAWRLAPLPFDTRRTFLWGAHITSHFSEPVSVGDLELRLRAEVPRESYARGRTPTYLVYEVGEAARGEKPAR